MSDLVKRLMADVDDDGEPPHICTVRLRTTYWHDRKGLYAKRSLTFLQRKCSGRGSDLLTEECDNVGAEDIGRCLGLISESTPDGVYTVDACNFSRDWETGYIDGYDLELNPVKEEA